MDVGLHARHDDAWRQAPDAERDRRVHPRVPGDRSGSFVQRQRREADAAIPVRGTWCPEYIRSDNGLEFVANEI